MAFAFGCVALDAKPPPAAATRELVLHGLHLRCASLRVAVNASHLSLRVLSGAAIELRAGGSSTTLRAGGDTTVVPRAPVLLCDAPPTGPPVP